MKKLVVHIIDRLPPDGAERLIVEVLKNRSDNYEFEVLALIEGGPLVQDLEAMGVPVTILGRRNGLDWRHAVALYRWLADKQPHIIHTHLFTADAWGRTFAFIRRVPGIFSTVHSTNTWKSKIHLAVDRLLSKISTRIVACTGDVMKTIVSQGLAPAKVVNIPNGVDLNRIDQASEIDIYAEFGLADRSAPVFALVGRLHEAKGHTDLLPVLEQLRIDGHTYYCLFIGEGDLEANLKDEVTRRGLTENVIFSGFRQDVISLLKSIDFLVMPSRWEGLPITLLESMASSAPAVATTVGGIPDLIEHHKDGLLCAPGDPEALQEAILTMLTNTGERSKMAEAGQIKIQSDYSAAAVSAAYERLYDQVD